MSDVLIATGALIIVSSIIGLVIVVRRVMDELNLHAGEED